MMHHPLLNHLSCLFVLDTSGVKTQVKRQRLVWWWGGQSHGVLYSDAEVGSHLSEGVVCIVGVERECWGSESELCVVVDLKLGVGHVFCFFRACWSGYFLSFCCKWYV